MERVVTDDRVGGVPGVSGRLVIGRSHVHRDSLDRFGTFGAELVEEAVQGGSVPTLQAPDELSGPVVAHHREVGVALTPRHLIDADHEQVVQALGVQAGLDDPLDDPAGGVPVDPHQALQRGLVHRGRQPADQVLEVPGEPRTCPGERDPFGPDPMRGAVQPAQVRPDLQPPRTQVQVPPRRGHRPPVVLRLGREHAQRAVQLPGRELDGDDHRGRLELHLVHGDTGQAQKTLECCRDAHGLGLLGSVGFASPNLETTRARHPTSPSEGLTDTPQHGQANEYRSVTHPAGPQPLRYNENATPKPLAAPTLMPEDPHRSSAPPGRAPRWRCSR
jgi:hypothetical protein